MNPEEKHGLSNFHYQVDGEMKPLDATVSEIRIEPSKEVRELFLGPRTTSFSGTFTSNIRNLSPILARYFKKVSALGYVYIDDISNLF